MKNLAYLAFAAAMAFSAPASATPVNANNSGTTDLGFFTAGNYTITATGLVDLVGAVGNGFDIQPDGLPGPGGVTYPGYGYFNPNGSYIADGNQGPGGLTTKIGGLMGSFVAIAPLGDFAPPNANYFVLGYSTNVTLLADGDLYAQVNDTFYSNNGGFFDVTVAPLAAVPEPLTLSLFGAGLAGAAALRRRKKV